MAGSGHGHHAGGAHVKTKFLKCIRCGRIHVGITKAEADTEVRTVNEYLARLSPEARESGYGSRTASIEHYKKCSHCGAPSETFIPAIGFENSGVTMQSVIAPRLEKCDQ